jgi:hypothetical protein
LAGRTFQVLPATPEPTLGAPMPLLALCLLAALVVKPRRPESPPRARPARRGVAISPARAAGGRTRPIAPPPRHPAIAHVWPDTFWRTSYASATKLALPGIGRTEK